MVVDLLRGINLICFRPLLRMLRFLVLHKFSPLLSDLTIAVFEIWSLVLLDKFVVQAFLPILELIGHLAESKLLDSSL